MEMLTADPHAIRRFGNIQIQWHRCVPGIEERYPAIHRDLLKTHELTWGNDKYIWQNWRLRK